MKLAIELIRVAPSFYVGVDSEGGWCIRLHGVRYGVEGNELGWFGLIDEAEQYALDLAALTVRSVDAFQAVLFPWQGDVDLMTRRLDDSAVRKLIKRVNELWTFK